MMSQSCVCYMLYQISLPILCQSRTGIPPLPPPLLMVNAPISAATNDPPPNLLQRRSATAAASAVVCSPRSATASKSSPAAAATPSRGGSVTRAPQDAQRSTPTALTPVEGPRNRPCGCSPCAGWTALWTACRAKSTAQGTPQTLDPSTPPLQPTDANSPKQKSVKLT